MSNCVSGVVCSIEPTKTYGAKGFKKRQIVLEQDKGSFANYVPIDVVRDMCEEADVLCVGDEVQFAFQLSGRKWQKDADSDVKYFLSAEALSFVVLSSRGVAASSGDDEEAPF